MCTEAGIKLLRSCSSSQVDRHLTLGRPGYVCCPSHLFQLHLAVVWSQVLDGGVSERQG
jgi:hypothetical protein